MTILSRHYAVLLDENRIGTLCQRGDHTRLVFSDSYINNPQRPVLGLRFEENLRKPYGCALRLPPWFSNLLPEGPLRQWIADDRGVSVQREMELLAQVGHDLPGAIQIVPTSNTDGQDWSDENYAEAPRRRRTRGDSSPWKFSLAGVALKFSMLKMGDRLTVPVGDELGDWLVKFPDYKYTNVPHNEYAMMCMARSLGIEVPDIQLVHRDELAGVPEQMWPNEEKWAYAIRRFDRNPQDRSLIHIEDFAQVRDFYPEEKYRGTFETVAALAYRQRDLPALKEFARRLAFIILIGNGDAHLKNWSLIYRDSRIPTLSPAYDLVSTVPYQHLHGGPEDLGLRFNRTKRLEVIQLAAFSNLESSLNDKLGYTGADLIDIAADIVTRIEHAWAEHREILDINPVLANRIDQWIRQRRAFLLHTAHIS